MAPERSGEGDDYAIVVAYLPAGVPVRDWWPEATEIESTEHDAIVFTDRFPRPDWWEEPKQEVAQ